MRIPRQKELAIGRIRVGKSQSEAEREKEAAAAHAAAPEMLTMVGEMFLRQTR